MKTAADLGLVAPDSSPKPKTASDLGLVPPAGPSAGERFTMGVADPLVGLAQSAVHAGVPAPVYGMPEFGMSFGEQPLAKTSDVDKAVQQREQQYEERRKASGQTGIDWLRGSGSFLTNLGLTAPLSVIGGPELTGASALGKVLGGARLGATAGAASGATEPVTNDHFALDKSLQIAGGAVTGTVLGALTGGVESAVYHFLVPTEDRIAQQATDAVVRRLNQDVKAGGPTADDALKQVADWRKEGKPMTLADVGGENVQALAGHVARQPGEGRAIAKTALTDRDKQAAARLTADVGKYISSDSTAYQTAKALIAARSQAARPLYQQAESLQGIWSPRLQQFLENSDVQKGLARGYRLERLDALAENRPFDPTQMGVDLDADGNVKLLKVPNLRVLDMGKRGLDAMIADERDSLTGRLSSLGRSLEGVRRSYVNEIDGLDTSGVYREARNAWAGPSSSLDALKFGRTIFNRNPEEISSEFANMSANDREFARLGVADILREKIAKTGFSGNEARALIKNSWTRDQLRPILRSEEDFDKFVDSVMAEHTMKATQSRVLGGSPTATRLAEDTSPENRARLSMAALAHSIASGRPLSALRHAYQIKRDLGLRSNEKLNEAVAKILFSENPQLAAPQVPKKSVISTVAPTLGAMTGTMSGSAFQ